MMEVKEKNINIEVVVGFILNVLNSVFLIIVMLLIHKKIHSIVDKRIVEGLGYIFSGFSIILPVFARKIYLKIKNKHQAKMVVYVLYDIPLIFGFIYFLLGGYLRYSIGFAALTVGYFFFAAPFVFGGEDG